MVAENRQRESRSDNCAGRVFQSRLPATGKTQAPMVTSLVGLTVNRSDNDERRCRRLVSATRRMSSTW